MLFIEQINRRLVLERTSPRERGYGQTRASELSEVARLIEEARAAGATELDLSGRGLTELPEAIGQLSRLQDLVLTTTS